MKVFERKVDVLIRHQIYLKHRNFYTFKRCFIKYICKKIFSKSQANQKL